MWKGIMNLSETGANEPLKKPQKSTGRVWSAVTVSLLLLSVMLNVMLAHRLRSLIGVQSAEFSERLLKIGTILPAFQAVDLKGRSQRIAYGEVAKPTVLYIFTPPCGWCARNIDNFKTLVDKVRGGYRFIGLSLSNEGLPEYVGKNELMLPVYSGLSPETLKTYKLGSTPQTIGISPEC